MSESARGRYPNLFLVGAPKCGTTSMVHYLGQHPDIFEPPSKEPHYFCSDFVRARSYQRDEQDYLDIYEEWKDQRYALDASTGYLYSQAAAREISACSPEARIIVMVRNPVDAVYSMYFENRYAGVEQLETFEEALAEEDRRAARGVPPKRGHLQRLLYTRIYRYAEHISRYREVFGADRVHVLVFDDFKTDPRSEYSELVRKLGLDTSCVNGIEFPVKNSAKRPLFAPISRLAAFPPKWLGRVTAPVLTKSQRSRLRKIVRNAVAIRASNPPMKPETRRALAQRFAPEVARLSEMLGRDFSHWVRVDG